MRHYLILILVPLLAAPGGDHLLPERAIGEHINAPYELALARLFFAHTERRSLTALVIPSFIPEYTVYVWEPLDQYEYRFKPSGKLPPPKAVLKRARASLWSETFNLMERRASPGVTPTSRDGDATFLDARVDVETVSNPLDEATVELLKRAWDLALRDVRYSDDDQLGFDGVTYHLSTSRRAGYVWSPDDRSPRMKSLVSLVEVLAAYAAAKPGEEANRRLIELKAAALNAVGGEATTKH